MYKKPKKEFPIKYMHKGLFDEEDFDEDKIKKKVKRHIKKQKFSAHVKKRAPDRKTK